MKKQYIAVTIGPIFDTMSLVSTPAALWISSYMFSCITREICEALLVNGVKEEDIITPYFSKTDTTFLDKNDGVGLFHDHIIFVAENFDIKDFNKIKNAALKKISVLYGLDFSYLEQYIQIAAVKYEAKNPILGCENILNSRELEKPFVANDPELPLMNLLFSAEPDSHEYFGKNEKIKKIAKALNISDRWQLLEGTDIKTLEMIVDPYYKTESQREAEKKKEGGKKNAKPAMKKHRYYAIIRSDGDNMSQIISSLEDDDKGKKTVDGGEVDRSFRTFSRTCLDYCSAIADEVARFDGVTIYAGGDDLLAILPCENQAGQTPFEFVESANKIFNEKFKNYGMQASLSFSVTMCYYKFPLYEALENSADLLFDVAKNKAGKNCAVIHLQKHSGQSEGLVIPNAALKEFLAFKNVIVKPNTSQAIAMEPVDANEDPTANDKSAKENERVIVSALHKLSLFEHLLKAVGEDQEAVITLFKNIFDSREQQTEFLHKKLPVFYHSLRADLPIRALTDDGIQSDPVKTVAYVLRVLKFFNEKAGEKIENVPR